MVLTRDLVLGSSAHALVNAHVRVMCAVALATDEFRLGKMASDKHSVIEAYC